jgi:hypothetical protein
MFASVFSITAWHNCNIPQSDLIRSLFENLVKLTKLKGKIKFAQSLTQTIARTNGYAGV